ncbi:MAG TPA: hypothetical protein VN408_36310 [Actinoplanes sp.]|nr:hypothetical protein [Actinoplanes sp.]
MRKFTKRSAALVTAGVVAVSGGAAYAAWFLGGGGSGAASAAGSVNLILINNPSTTENVTVTPAFFPGSTNSVKFTVKNPNPFPVRITDVDLVVGTSTNKPACLGTNVTVNSAAPLPTGTNDLIVQPNNGTKSITYTGALSMDNNSDPSCDGASFPITVSLTANSGTAPATPTTNTSTSTSTSGD